MDIKDRLVDKSSVAFVYRNAYSVYCADRKVPERNRNLMPVEFISRVCTCVERRGYITTDQYPGIINTCSACHKPESYYLFRCTRCESLFIHDFRAPFCYDQPHCWECVNEDPYICEGHHYCQPYWTKDKWVAPVLPKPKTYTAEELDNVFDF